MFCSKNRKNWWFAKRLRSKTHYFKNHSLLTGVCSDEYTLSADFSNCSYSAHPSLLMLSGHSNQIELKDLRGVFTGLMISDLNVPFCSVNTLITHHNDPNLIAISCQTDVYSPVLSCDEITSEVRIYDIRYPKESTMRIASDIPITQFISFESYGNGGHGKK